MKYRMLSTEFWKTVLGFRKAPSEATGSSPESEQVTQETPLPDRLAESDQVQSKPEEKQKVEQEETPKRENTREVAGERTARTRTEEKSEYLIVGSELNLEQNSVFAVSTYRGKSREIVVKETKPGGEIVERRAIIGKTAGGIETGVLTTYHFRVYLALIELWEKAGRPISEPVHFTILRIIKQLGLSHDGRTYARMKRWLLDMGQIPLTFINSFFVPKDSLYRTLDPLHILSYLRIYERRKMGRQQKTYGYGEFQFDRHILENLVNNHVHPLRLDVVNSFKKHKDLSILLYIYLDRNLAFKDKYEIGLEKLFNHLDLSQKQVRYPSDRKAKIDPVLEQLRGRELSTGVLSYAQIHKTADGKDYKLVCRKKPFPRRLGEQVVASQPQLALPTKAESGSSEAGSESTETKPEFAKSSSELLPLLIEKGLTQKQAAKLVAEKSPDVISDQLEYLPFRIEEYKAQRKTINEAAILYDSINDNWNVPKGYLEAEKGKEREARRLKQERIARLEQEERDRAEQERAEMEAYKETLSSEERAKLREKALAEIRGMEGVKEEFITDILIKAKENEILKVEMENGD